VQSFGGNPGQILPSPLGNGVPGLPGYPGHPGRPPHPGHPGPGHPRPGEPEHPSFTGKIEGIVYDHFGDFEGFILVTLKGERHRFHSHEARVLAIVRRAWMLRSLMTVTVRHDHREQPFEMILHGAPPHEEWN
jgi:hypothetical protein